MERIQGTTPPQGGRTSLETPIPRRPLLKLLGLSGAALALPAGLSGCGTGPGARPDRTIRIGFVAPRTGPLATFSEADDYVIGTVQEQLRKGLKAGGSTYGIEVAVRDSQSDAQRAAEVTASLIDDENVSLVMAHSDDTVPPVAQVCEEREVPCLSSILPTEQWASDLTSPKTAYHFYWAQKDSYTIFIHMWGALPSNKTVGSLWPRDPSGATWGDGKRGFPPVLAKAGYRLVDPGRITPQTNVFGPVIDQFKDAPVDILTGSLQPPDFATFWKQSELAGYRPMTVSMSRAIQSPSFVEAMSPSPEGLTTAAGWTPAYPFRSSLTGIAASGLAEDWSARTDKQWTQQTAFTHALFEVAVDALKRADDPRNREAVAAALGRTNVETIVGRVDFTKGPTPHVAVTPMVGAQWRRSSPWPYELVIVHSMTNEIPAQGELRPLR